MSAALFACPKAEDASRKSSANTLFMTTPPEPFRTAQMAHGSEPPVPWCEQHEEFRARPRCLRRARDQDFRLQRFAFVGGCARVPCSPALHNACTRKFCNS